MPTHRAAILESVANVGTGAMINLTLCQWLIFPLLGVPVRLDQNLALTLALTVVALLRNYAVRRCFAVMVGRKPRYRLRVALGRRGYSIAPSKNCLNKLPT